MIINIIETTNMTNYAYRELSKSITVISNLVNLWNLMLNISLVKPMIKLLYENDDEHCM